MYTCPEGQRCTYKMTDRKNDGNIRLYTANKCKGCINKNKCTLSTKGREIHRWEFAIVINKLKDRLKQNPQLIKKRKTMVRHIFETLKKYGTIMDCSIADSRMIQLKLN
jgi:hypothetical protein